MRIEDREKIDALRAEYSCFTASHSFLSLFIYGYETVVRDEGFYAVNGSGEYLFPVGSDAFKRDFVASHKGADVVMMRREDAEFVAALSPGREAERDRDADEYVYSRAEQASLEGHKFQKIRAKLSRFYRENDVKNVALTAGNTAEAYGILEKWAPKAGEGDYAGAKKALDNYAALGLTGMITYINGEAVGYCCGADIGGGVYMLCSAKQICDTQGLNLSTKHELFKTLPESAVYINTESDHGSPGIRMHKNDQRPVLMNEMYKIVL